MENHTVTAKIKWLDRTILAGAHLTLVTSQKQFEAVLKQKALESDEPYVREGWQACTHTWKQPKYGAVLCVVAIDPEMFASFDPIDAAALLVHEATHVWQRTRETIGDKICDETEAYAIQNICAQLFTAYRETLK